MRFDKRRYLTTCILWGLFILASPVWGQSTLTSIKTGEEGNSSWAIFTFDDRVEWVGISQSETGGVSLYFLGSPGNLQNTTHTVDPFFGGVVSIKQVSRSPSVFRSDIDCPEDIPIAVMKKDRYLVVAFNNAQFLEGKPASLDVEPPAAGRLIGISPDVQDDLVMTSFEFEGYFDWAGYVSPSRDEATLLFHGARLFTDTDEFSFQESALQQVRFFQDESAKTVSLKAVLSFTKPSSCYIIRKSDRLIVQTSHTVEQSVYPEEEAAATQEVVLADSGYAESESAEKPLDSIVQDIEDDMGVLDDNSQGTSFAIQPAGLDMSTGLPSIGESAIQYDEPSYDSIGQGTDDNAPTEAQANSETGSTWETQQEEGIIRPNVTQSGLITWDELVSFEFSDIPIKDALRLVAAANSLNMVIGEGVEGLVTMDLKNVTLRQALNRIVHTHDCDYTVDNGIITVKPLKAVYSGGSITKVYRLKYADAENVAIILRQVVSNDSLVRVFHREFLNYPESGKNRRDANEVAVQGIRRSSILVVTDLPDKIRQVDSVIKELDKPPIQIMIESKLVELSPMHSNELGINWDKTINAAVWGQNILQGGDVQDYAVINTDPANGGEWQLASLSAGKYQAVLDFLKQKTDSKLKSNPRLLAMDNEESSISVGTTVPVPRIQRGLGGQGDMVTFEYKEVNIQLNVTPHVTGPKEITMYVNPVIEEITGWVEYEQHRAPITDKRTVNSIVTVKNGETVVIGGLIKSQRIRTQQKVWLLGSLPLLGRLFQHEQYEDKQTDLMIFITPRIIRTG